VELGLEQDAAHAAADATHRRELSARQRAGEVVLVRARAFVDLEFDDGRQRWHGNERHVSVELDRDPTNQLMDVVDDERRDLLNLYADIAHGGDIDVTRWEFYGAPFHINLSKELEARLAGAWQPRPPRRR
jgi:hypothetical protein